MNLNIKATNIDLSPELESYLEKKLASLGRIIDFDAPNTYAHVELAKTTEHHKSGKFFMAEINVRVDGRAINARADGEDIHAAIDTMKDELSRELKAGKEKWMTKMRKGALKAKEIIKNLRRPQQ